MKLKILFFLCLISTFAFSQKEASNWYFGVNAGIKFNNNGTVTALTDGQLSTSEGCASISDSSGNLLFYTNGVIVWNKNHQVMLNGTGLMGDQSTTQSATIVPLPGSSSMFYLFTLDYEVNPNGFRYSIVDMSLDSGLGGVTANKNVLIYAPSNEKLAVVKHANNTDYWIVTHGWNNDSFNSHLLTATGLSATPVTSNAGLVVTGSTENVWGYMKISPDGSKLAISHSLNKCELMDFNSLTGVVSNAQTVFNDVSSYGVEFSPNSEVLYVSVAYPRPYKIIQYDLTASNITIPSYIHYNSSYESLALQLGPDSKIYIAHNTLTKLGVINNPNVVGIGCGIQPEAIDLLGRTCLLGLPPFVASFFFNPEIQLQNSCEGDNVQFTLNTNQTITSAVWDFGDGSPTQNSPTVSHVYPTAGPYTVTVTITSASGTTTKTRDIVINPLPIVTSTSLKQCDDNIDGFSIFNLTEANSKISTNAVNETFAYFETQAEAESNSNPILNFTTYTNQVVSNDVVYVRVTNEHGCFKVVPLNLIVSTTQIPLNFTRQFTACDDAVLGTHVDGVAAFDFSSVTSQIQSIFPVGQLLNISYYKNVNDALAETNAITNISNYRNVGYPNLQDIYVRVDSQLNNDCLGLGSHIALTVERIPVVSAQIINHCDDDQDGLYGFDTTTVQTNLLNGLTGVSVAYFDQNNVPLPSPLPNPFVTSSQTVKAIVANTTPTACSYETTIQFIVDDFPEAFALPTSLTTLCDDEPNPLNQDGLFAFDTGSFQNTILGTQTGMLVNYFDGNNNALSSPLPNPMLSGTQNIRVEVINPLNISCFASMTIPLVVQAVPNISMAGNEIVCNEPSFTKIIDADIVDGSPTTDYTYVWKKDGQVIASATNYDLTVFEAGVYTVDVFNANGCSRTRTITVIASDKATVTNVEIIDLSNPNSVTIYVIGSGNYVYALDNENGVYQEENTFTSVSAGIHTVYIKDLNGCGTTPKEIAVLGIPDYFTPNGDGIHDYWNIQGANANFNKSTIIYIFDRFGKLLKEISPTSLGWNGSFNNEVMPASDYWYSIVLENGKSVKGHFALKR